MPMILYTVVFIKHVYKHTVLCNFRGPMWGHFLFLNSRCRKSHYMYGICIAVGGYYVDYIYTHILNWNSLCCKIVHSSQL